MRRFILPLVLLTSSAHFAFGQECDMAKLRELIGYPKRVMIVEGDLKVAGRDDYGDLIDSAKKIADLSKQLTGGVDDVKIYVELYNRYVHLEDKVKAEAALAKQFELLKPHLGTTDPKKVHLLRKYCVYLHVLVPFPLEEFDKYTRKAAQIAPDDCKTWVGLSTLHAAQASCMILGKERAKLGSLEIYGRSLDALQRGLVPLSVADEAEKQLTEACRCRDRAKALAPDEPFCRKWLLDSLISERRMRMAIDQARGKKSESSFASAEILAEAAVVARLHPDKLEAQNVAASLELRDRSERNEGILGRTNMDRWTPEDKKFFAAYRDRVIIYRDRSEQIAGKASTIEGKIFCLTTAMGLGFNLDEPKHAEVMARKILALDPKRDSTATFLAALLGKTQRLKEAEDLMSDQWVKYPTAPVAGMYASLLVKGHRDADAEKILRGAVQRWPDDFHCVLGLAAIIMRSNDGRTAREEAEKLLDRAQWLTRSGKNDGAERITECDYYRAVHSALCGDTALAHLKLLRLQSENPGDDRFTQALSAFKR